MIKSLNKCLPITCLLVLGGLLSLNSQAEDGWNTEGEHGELHIYGTLSEGACRLDMRSAYQEVMLNNLVTSTLRHPGDSAEPTPFVVRLLDCQRTRGEQTDSQTETVTSDAIQPVLTITFVSALNPEEPSLFKMEGISGAGLQLRDSRGRLIHPGERSIPQFVSPGSNQLAYTIVPVRTRAPLVAGEFRAVVDFRINYD